MTTTVTARTTLLCTLYCELVNDALADLSYDASHSGLMYNFTNHIRGLLIDVSGYNDKLDVLLEKVVLQVRGLEVSEDRFKIIRDRMLRYLRNSEYAHPFNQVGTYSEQFEGEKSVTNDELLPELENVTAQNVQQFFPQILAQCHIEVLAHGNLYNEEALKIIDLVGRAIKPRRLLANQVPTRRGLIWPSGSNFINEKQFKGPRNINHCIEYSLYTGHRYDSVMRAKLLLFGHMTNEPCFNELRTIEQLGYVVFSGPSLDDVWSGYCILIQSEKGCRYLKGRIENFLNIFEQKLNDMSEEDFERHKRAMINNRMAKLENLSSGDSVFWNHIYSDSYGFLQAQAKAKEPSLGENKTAAAAVLNITADDEASQTRVEGVSSKKAISDAIAGHLTDDLKVEEEVADKVLDEAKAELGIADSGLSAPPQALNASTDVKEVVDASHPVLIENVHLWKASMQVSSDVRLERDLEEFVEVA
ncbi:hypothetical protein AA0121_g13303 [Alternaria tenuissima]|nr:hypothetical protein AA0121_g13303 [Alternaria tenuissima]